MKIICLTGPTAAGKSASVLALSKLWPIEIINVDSATIYKGMDIGTAKPSKEEQTQTIQHLLNIRDPSQNYSAAEFVQDTLKLIDEIVQRERIPILVGGTMMYYKALKEGLDNLPTADISLRKEIDAQAQIEGWPAIHKRLSTLDPITAARLSPNDGQRIQRALEVCLLTGQAMSELLGKTKKTATRHQYHTISLEPSERQGLHQRIESRFDAMLAQGLVNEVQALYQRGDLHPNLPSIRCVGYRQIWGFLEGEYHLTKARDLGIIATRHLAKRQMTWLRSDRNRICIDCLAPNATDLVIQEVGKLLG